MDSQRIGVGSVNVGKYIVNNSSSSSSSSNSSREVGNFSL
jgi:hypothetical protein